MTRIRFVQALAVALLMAAAVGVGRPINRVLAQPPATAPAPRLKANQVPEEKRVSVSFDNVPWNDVLDWYGKETGLALATTVKPTGCVTIKTPKDKKYTITDVTDLLNESLRSQKFRLIRFKTTFTTRPLDEPLDGSPFTLLQLSDLAERGKSEIVMCTIGPFENITASEYLGELEKMLTPFGKVILLEKQNAFQIVDTVENIRRIAKELSKT